MVMTAPSFREETRRQRLSQPLVLGGLVTVATVALHFRDPHRQGSWGFCPFKLLSGGLDCPGCGGLRAVNDLTNLDLAGAACSNLLLVVLLPVLVVGWVLWVRRAWRGPTPAAPPHRPTVRVLTIALVVVTVGFTVVRNLPAGSWLAS